MDENGKTERVIAPFVGITKAGTRRVLVTHEDTEWTTVHATEKTDPNEIEEEITESENVLLPKDFKQAYRGNPNDLCLLQ